jgi:hypothetical protein
VDHLGSLGLSCDLEGVRDHVSSGTGLLKVQVEGFDSLTGNPFEILLICCLMRLRGLVATQQVLTLSSHKLLFIVCVGEVSSISVPQHLDRSDGLRRRPYHPLLPHHHLIFGVLRAFIGLFLDSVFHNVKSGLSDQLMPLSLVKLL